MPAHKTSAITNKSWPTTANRRSSTGYTLQSAMIIMVLAASLMGQQSFASTGEAQGKVVRFSLSDLLFEIIRISHISHWQDRPMGEVVSTDAPTRGAILIDGMLSNWDTAKRAIQEGYDFYIHNNRSWNQVFSTQTTPLLVHGQIVDSDPNNNRLTVRHVLVGETRARHNPDQPAYVDKVITVKPSDVVTYEGKETAATQAIQVGRHARVHQAREQTILAFTPEALEAPHKQDHNMFIQQGFFKGYHDRHVYFAEQRDGQWIDAFRPGQITRTNYIGADMLLDLDGVPIVRPGDRATFIPYGQPGPGLNSRMVFLRPADDGSIEGHIRAINGDTITLEVVTCATGRAADITTREKVITLKPDAIYNLNGSKNQPRDEALQVGNYVRVLPEWSGAILVRDLDQEKATLSERPAAKPYFIVGEKITGPFLHPSHVTTMENTTIRLEAYAVALPDVTYQWYQDGVKLPGANNRFYDHIAFMEDHGSEFVCVASGPDGSATAPPTTLIVSADTSPLTVAGASIADAETIQLTFNKQVNKASAENMSNYAIDQDVRIHDVTLIGDMSTVILKTSALTSGQDYAITVNNVIDRSGSPNQLADNTQIPVSFRVAFRFLRFQTIEKPGLTPRIAWLRFFEDGVSQAENREYFGHKVKARDAAKGFHQGGRVSVNTGESIGVDMQPGNEIAPDSFSIATGSASGRNFTSWKIEGSNDRENWVLLYDGTDSPMLHGNSYEFDIDLSGLDPKDILTGAKQAQKIQFPKIPDLALSRSPLTLDIKASSQLPVTVSVLAGPAEINDDQLTLSDAGEVILRAVQEGDDRFYPAYPITQIFTVTTD